MLLLHGHWLASTTVYLATAGAQGACCRRLETEREADRDLDREWPPSAR
jgi:hypothetical protein